MTAKTYNYKTNTVNPPHTMNSEDPSPEAFTEARRESISKSIRTISIEELKALGERLFPSANDTWREKYFGLIAENPGETFYYAKTSDHFEVVYCHAKNKGIWYQGDFGKGPIPPDSLELLKQIVDKL